MFCSPTQTSWQKTEWAKKIITSTPRTWKYIYSYNIYKMSLFNPICTLFTKTSEERCPQKWSAASSGNTQIFSRKNRKKFKVTKKWNPKINWKKKKKKTKKKKRQKQNLSSTSILRPTAPSIPTRLALHMCSPSQFVVVHGLRSKGK